MSETIWDNEARKAAQDAVRCYGVLSDESELAFYRTFFRNYTRCVFETPEKYAAFNYIEDAFGGVD